MDRRDLVHALQELVDGEDSAYQELLMKLLHQLNQDADEITDLELRVSDLEAEVGYLEADVSDLEFQLQLRQGA